MMRYVGMFILGMVGTFCGMVGAASMAMRSDWWKYNQSLPVGLYASIVIGVAAGIALATLLFTEFP